MGLLRMRVQQGCPAGPSPQLPPPPHLSITPMQGEQSCAVCHSSVLLRWGGRVRQWGLARAARGATTEPCGPSASPGYCLLLPSHSAPGTTSSAARHKPEESQDPPSPASTNLGARAQSHPGRAVGAARGTHHTVGVPGGDSNYKFPEAQGHGNVYTN